MKKIASFLGILLSIALIIIFTWVSISGAIESSSVTSDLAYISIGLLVTVILFMPIVFISLALNLYSIFTYNKKRLLKILLLVLSLVAYVSILVVTCVINDWTIFDLLRYFLNFILFFKK